MSREAHVRFWERVGVKFPRATRFCRAKHEARSAMANGVGISGRGCYGAGRRPAAARASASPSPSITYMKPMISME